MTLFKTLGKLTLFVAIGLSAGCKVVDQQTVYTLEVKKQVVLQDKNKRPVTLQPGAPFSWSLLVVSSKNQTGMVLQQDGKNGVQIPFAVPAGFFLGSGDVSESATQQGYGIKQIAGERQDVQSIPRSRIETCTISRTEHICDRDQTGQQKCIDRTITSSGQKTVTTTPQGYREPLEVDLIKNGIVAVKMKLDLDHTSERRDESPCY